MYEIITVQYTISSTMTTHKPTLVLIKEISSLSEITDAMAHVFQDAQMTLSGHRKLVVLLRNIQTRAISIGYEEAFNFQFTKLTSKILKLRKGIPAADRIAKFCSVFVATILKEETETPTSRPENDENSEDELETVSSEFVDNLIRHLLRGIESKFKEVRYRVVQLLAYLVNYITEIDEQLFKALHYSLNRRLYDREPIVRIQAVVAISRFQYFHLGDENEVNSATKSLLAAVKHDDSPEVRRAALLNLVKNPYTVPSILGRAHDVNAINRRLVYSRILKEITAFKDIDVEIREQLLSWGLNDRDPSVKSAAVGMLTKTWLSLANEEILELIENLQVVDSEVAETAMDVLFDQKRDKLDAVEIAPESWKELTVEKAFFIRTYFDFCNANKLYDNIERNVPELTKLAFILQEYLKLRNLMLESNSDLLDEYKTYQHKQAKFSHLIKDGQVEKVELSRRLVKESAYKEQLEEHVQKIEADVESKKEDIRLLSADRKKKSGRKFVDFSEEEAEQYINNLKLELKDLETEHEKSASALEEYTASVTTKEDRLKELAKILVHQNNEKGKFVESTLDLEEKFHPLGEQLKELEFVIEQLLLIIRGSDFADVAGTRRLLPCITNALTNDKLADKLISISVSILRKISIDESYFSGLCTEIITDIRDSTLDENDETFVSAASIFGEQNDEDDDDEDDDQESQADESQKRRKVAPSLPPDDLLIQCLMILQHYLEIVEDPLANIHQLESLIDTLIRPAISNNLNSTIRLLGYRTLGLFSLIDKGLASSNLKFFGMSASKAQDEELKILSTKIIFDVLSSHGVGILDDKGDESVDSLSLARLFYSLLKTYEMPQLQAVVAEGLCKLFLADLLVNFGKGELHNSDDEQDEPQQETQLLEMLLLSYFHPLNAKNQELKQTLAFCIPVYAFSHENHQRNVSAVSGDCFYRIFRTDSELGRYENLASPSTVIQQLIYWCDPHNLVNVSPEDARKNPSHFWQIIKLLQVVEQDSPKNVKKAILLNLNKMAVSEDLGSELLKGLKSALDDTRQVISSNQDNGDFALDSATDKGLDKFQASIDEFIEKAERTESEARARTPVRSRTASVSSVTIEVSMETAGEEAEQKQEETLAENSKTETPKSKEPDLSEIDRLLDAEENVDYDIDME